MLLSYDAVVLGAGVAGLSAAARLAEAGARVCVLAKGVGLDPSGAGHRRRARLRRPERVEAPADALPGFIAAHPDHPYALLGRRRDRARARVVRRARCEPGRSRATATRRRSSATTCCRRRSARPGPSALVPGDDGRRRPATAAPVCVVGHPGAAGLPPLAAAPATSGGPGSRPARSRSTSTSGRAESNALGLARALDDPASAAGFAARLVPLMRTASAWRCRRSLGLRRPARRLGGPRRSGSGGRCSRSPRCRRRCLACASTTRCAPRCARPAAGSCSAPRWSAREREGERVTARARARQRPRQRLRRALGGARHRRLRLRRDRAGLGLERARDRARAAAARRAGRRRAALPARVLRRPADGAASGIAVDGVAAAPRAPRTCSSPARSLPGAQPWRENSGEGIALASGYAAAPTILEREGSRAAA